MNWTLIDEDGQSAASPNSVTSDALDTTGANALFALVATDAVGDGGSAGTFSDSKGNTWVALTPQITATSSPRARLYYSMPSSVGGSHTFTYARTDGYASIYVWAYDSGADTFEFEDENGDVQTDQNNLSPGNVTPSDDGALVLAGIAFSAAIAGDAEADNGFTETPMLAFNSGVSYGLRGASLEQPTAAAITTTFSWSGSISFQAAAVVAAFLPAAAGGGASVGRKGLMLLGVS